MDNRLHVRLADTYHEWIASLGTAESDAARALLIAGAAALGLAGAGEEAERLLLARPRLSLATLRALESIVGHSSDTRRTLVGHSSDDEQGGPVPTLENQGLLPSEQAGDPFDALGFDV